MEKNERKREKLETRPQGMCACVSKNEKNLCNGVTVTHSKQQALQLLEYLIINGSDRVIDEARENIFSIRTLRNFRYVDEKGKDHGSGIRDLSRKLSELLKDEEEIIKLKREARKNKNKYAGISASDARYRMRRSRYESRSRYDDDDSRESPSPASYGNDDHDDDDGDREYRRRRDSIDSGGRRRNDPSDEDSYSRRRSREGDVSSFRPRAGASTSSTRSDEEPVTRIRAPSFGSGATQVNLDASASVRQPPAVQETNIFDVTDFFDAPQQPVAAQQSVQQTSNNGISGGGMGFNPRGGVASSQPSQQSSDWSPNFDGSDNNAFGDDAWGPAPGAASAIVTAHNSKPTAGDSGFGFDDAFPTDDDFTTFQPGEMEEKKPDLWDMTKDLVQLDLSGGKQNQQPHRQQEQQQHSSTQASSQKMSLKDMQKKQGGGGMNRPAPSGFGMHPVASTVAPYGVPSHGFVQPQMGYGYGGQPYHPQTFGQQGMMAPMMGYGQQMGYINQGMQQQQQPPMGHSNQAPPPSASQPNKSNSIDDLFF